MIQSRNYDEKDFIFNVHAFNRQFICTGKKGR